jgi:hypothetical protein
LRLAYLRERLLAVAGEANFVAGLLHQEFEGHQDVGLVIDHEHALRHCILQGSHCSTAQDRGKRKVRSAQLRAT